MTLFETELLQFLVSVYEYVKLKGTPWVIEPDDGLNDAVLLFAPPSVIPLPVNEPSV